MGSQTRASPGEVARKHRMECILKVELSRFVDGFLQTLQWVSFSLQAKVRSPGRAREACLPSLPPSPLAMPASLPFCGNRPSPRPLLHLAFLRISGKQIPTWFAQMSRYQKSLSRWSYMSPFPASLSRSVPLCCTYYHLTYAYTEHP